MLRVFLLISFLLSGLILFAGKTPHKPVERKLATASKTYKAPVINGLSDDECWSQLPVINDFRQYQPHFDTTASFLTEVKIAYDNYAVYIMATMHDPSPDSILTQLGLRDEAYLNADMFTIQFDTYDNQLDAYLFSVTASGIQIDSRESDPTYDAVWQSEVLVTKSGWQAELKIPYSALRFAKISQQVWGMEITRTIRRYREIDQWALEILEASNDLPYWGKLKGIENINPPLRLSATPYVILQAEHYPDESVNNDISTSFGGGMDLKYGINESYTLDMSLLPDFSQVQSDNKIKNLTAFETVYEEQRPFFNEAVDLFTRGDIFYSRRIGKTPALFYSVEDSLNDGESILKNPVQQRLLNATKVSGRDKKGLAVGILNAITSNTYATVKNANGNTRKILTDPFTNYNLLVFDQALKNNSYAYITNTNVLRDHDFRNANVTAAGIALNDKTNTYKLSLSAGISQIFTPAQDTTNRSVSRGYKYDAGFARTKGNFQWTISRSSMNDKFDANDMGLTLYNNYNSNQASISYNIYTPFWRLREMTNKVTISNQNNFTTHKPQAAKLRYNTVLTTRSYLTIWFEAGTRFIETFDYYEPRTDGRYYMIPKVAWANIGFSSDYRKQFAWDGGFDYYFSSRDNTKGFSVNMIPIVRMNDHFTFRFSVEYEKNYNDFGYVSKLDDDVIFGKRNIETYENSLSGRYLFKNNVSLSLIARHYYAQGEYGNFYTLLSDGNLALKTDYNGQHDFIFNSFNVDMVFSWIFAPGSSLNFVWKNEIVTESTNIAGNYFSNFGDTFSEPQRNVISLKILYYIDYLSVKNRISK